MSLNPAIQPRTGVPVGLEGEAFLVRRNGMSCKIIVKDMVPLESTGSLFLTNLRLIFVCAKPVMVQGCLFSSFNFPLNTLKNEEFKQPIFGCNHLIGTVEPINGTGIQNSISFKLFFSQGGAQTFLFFFFRALRDVREGSNISQNQRLGSLALRGELEMVAVAAVDPNDPSIVYIKQPEQQQGTLL